MRQTDERTDGRPGKNNMSPDPEGGRHNSYVTLAKAGVIKKKVYFISFVGCHFI